MTKHGRLIDADMLLEKVEKIQPWDAYLGKYAQGIRHCMELVSLLIQDAPTIEPGTGIEVNQYGKRSTCITNTGTLNIDMR